MSVERRISTCVCVCVCGFFHAKPSGIIYYVIVSTLVRAFSPYNRTKTYGEDVHVHNIIPTSYKRTAFYYECAQTAQHSKDRTHGVFTSFQCIEITAMENKNKTNARRIRIRYKPFELCSMMDAFMRGGRRKKTKKEKKINRVESTRKRHRKHGDMKIRR